jgi:hypothetical protein
MQQRQLRLGDILDDYCPRERRVTNHAIVAMVGDTVKQTRCTTCDAEHEYKQAKVPRQRRKSEAPAALYAQVAASAPKRVTHDASASPDPHAAGHDVAASDMSSDPHASESAAPDDLPMHASEHESAPAVRDEDRMDHDERQADSESTEDQDDRDQDAGGDDEGPIHRRLIRASLPRPEGQQPPARPIPEFTIRQPGGRPNRFRPRHARGGQPGQHFQGNRSNGNVGQMRGQQQRPGGGGGRPGMMKRHGPPGRKRSK